MEVKKAAAQGKGGVGGEGVEAGRRPVRAGARAGQVVCVMKQAGVVAPSIDSSRESIDV